VKLLRLGCESWNGDPNEMGAERGLGGARSRSIVQPSGAGYFFKEKAIS
jgi:hypothetical protein